MLGSTLSTQMTPLPGGADGELWQPRFFDRALRTVKEYNEKVEYIHLNPVRAGLVSRPEDWSRPAGSARADLKVGATPMNHQDTKAPRERLPKEAGESSAHFPGGLQ